MANKCRDQMKHRMKNRACNCQSAMDRAEAWHIKEQAERGPSSQPYQAETIGAGVRILPAESFGPAVAQSPDISAQASKFDSGTPAFSGPSVSQIESVAAVVPCKRVARTWIFPMRNGIRSIMVGQRDAK